MLAVKEPEVAEWRDSFTSAVYNPNKDVISRWVAFMAFVDDSEKINNIGNVIVSINDPSEILYFIDSHPNLQNGTVNFDWFPRGKQDPVLNNGRYFSKDAQKRGNVDYGIIEQELEEFQDAIDDDVIDDIIFKAATLAGSLSPNSRFGAKPEYFRQLRDYYKNRRDTLRCEF